MKSEDKLPEKTDADRLAIERRVIAWIQGEASPFEISELTRLVSQDAKLAEYKRQMEQVHGWVGEALDPQLTTLHLSPERRQKLLKSLSSDPAESNSTRSKPSGSVLAFPLWGRRGVRWMKTLSVACSLLLTFLILRETWFSKPAHSRIAQRVYKGEETSSLQPQESVANESKKSEPENPPAPAGVDLASGVPVEMPAVTNADRSASSGTDADAVVQMAPFVTDASSDAGYGAKSTLAGSRIRAEWPTPSLNFSPLGKREFSARYVASASGFSSRSKKKSEQSAAVPDSTAVTTKSENSDEALVLSPFMVEAKGDSSVANEALPLAGTRIKTDLNDLASPISVVTKSFLEDTGARNASDLLDYSPGNEVGGLQGNFSAKPTRSSTKSALQDEVIDERDVQAQGAKSGAKRASEKIETGEQSAAFNPVSTFSLHVSDVSFRLAQVALNAGGLPDPSTVRPEEFYNAFDYGEASPASGEKVSYREEQSTFPGRQQRNLLKVSLRVPAVGRGAGQPLRLTLLLDRSGSMERDDRATAVRRALQVLVSLLGPMDRVTLIGFAREPHLLVESLPGNEGKKLLEILAHTPAQGGTNLEAALKLAGDLARRQQEQAGQNRVVLLTDGAANLGDADPAALAGLVETLRQEGISFDACGVGLDGLDDGMLESLTRHGGGRYTVLSGSESPDNEFAKQLAGAFRPAARDVKVQVRFNPARVGHYRLIGFENHRLKEADFRNDQVHAAELAANEAAIALYEIEVLPQGEGELGEVYVRFQDAVTGKHVEQSWTLPYDDHVPTFGRAHASLQLAGIAALVAEKLQGKPVQLDDLAEPMTAVHGVYASEARVSELQTMFNQLRRMEPASP